jgi:hypothetical protein
MKKRKKQIIRGIDTRMGHPRKRKPKVVLSRKQLEEEIARLTQKCTERSNECYLLKVQKGAIEEKLQSLREAYNSFDSAFNRAMRA